VEEKWISAQYNISHLTIIDDPRLGKRTDEVTEFQPGEPDPALFKVAEGYTVRERTAFNAATHGYRKLTSLLMIDSTHAQVLAHPACAKGVIFQQPARQCIQFFSLHI
jgi:hypothetical protein